MTLRCPECGQPTQVLSTRTWQGRAYPYIIRRRECPVGHRFTTKEVPVTSLKKHFKDPL